MSVILVTKQTVQSKLILVLIKYIQPYVLLSRVYSFPAMKIN